MESQPHRTDWFKDAGWGVFTHYLTTPEVTSEDWNKQVDAFDVDRLANQLSELGVKYYFITIGQNSGHYCSPNAAFDRLTGIRPSKASRRDLISDIADALAKRGIRLMVYLSSGAPKKDPVAVEKLKWKWNAIGAWNGPTTGDRLAEFQFMWEEYVREWSLRWGKKVWGWWIDGCYFADDMYRFPEPPNFQSRVAAIKAGNPDALVAFNPGVTTPVITLTEYEDYTAGEINYAYPACPGRWVEQAQYHILSYIGDWWCGKELRFRKEFVAGYTMDVISKGGVITWDVPITDSGEIPQPFVEQLLYVRDKVREL